MRWKFVGALIFLFSISDMSFAAEELTQAAVLCGQEAETVGRAVNSLNEKLVTMFRAKAKGDDKFTVLQDEKSNITTQIKIGAISAPTVSMTMRPSAPGSDMYPGQPKPWSGWGHIACVTITGASGNH